MRRTPACYGVARPTSARTPRLSDHVDLVHAADPAAAFESALSTGALLRLPTAGSTRAPRHVLRTARSWSDSFAAVSALSGIDAGARLWVPGPLRSTMNLFSTVHAHWAGATLVATATQASHAVLTPALLARSLVDGLPPGLTVVVAGDRLHTGLHDRATSSGLTVHHYYGAAELSFVAWGPHADALRPFPGVEVRADDGVLWVRSPYVCAGYDGPSGPLRRLPDGFVTVGDLGDVKGGHVVVRGRPDAVVTGGVTIAVADVERALAGATRAELAIVGVPHPELGAVVGAVVIAADDLPALRRRARADLAPAARPRMWFAADRLPLTPAGKLDRRRLADDVGEGRLRRLP